MQRRDALRGIIDTSNFAVMDQSAALPVRLPPKPVAGPAMSPAQVNDVERRLRCQCGCTLDVYTCRTTDFVCQVAPAMHRDVQALVQGGYDANEILDAFREVYGDRVLLAPRRRGMTLMAYLVPPLGIAVAVVALTVRLRRRGAMVHE
jgi:cytochrome c-type biogenesis protein CcmH